MNEPQLHHGARRIVPNSLEKIIDLFSLLGCEVSYREGAARWAMIGQEGVNFDIQLVEVDEVPIQTKTRMSSHVAFISSDPKSVMHKVEGWANERDIRFAKGG